MTPEERKAKKREQNREYMRKRRAADPEGESKRARKWYKSNSEKALAAVRRYKLAHPDRVKDSQHRTYRKHREEIAERTRLDRIAHLAKYRRRGRKSYYAERERAKERARKRYKLLSAALQASKTAQQAAQPATKRGRRQSAKEDRAYFDIGRRVEKLIPVGQKQNQRAIEHARGLVSDQTRLSYDSVAQYHKRFRQDSA